jgi:hypothetical protein
VGRNRNLNQIVGKLWKRLGIISTKPSTASNWHAASRRPARLPQADRRSYVGLRGLSRQPPIHQHRKSRGRRSGFTPVTQEPALCGFGEFMLGKTRSNREEPQGGVSAASSSRPSIGRCISEISTCPISWESRTSVFPGTNSTRSIRCCSVSIRSLRAARRSASLQHPIDRRPADLEGLHCAHPGGIYRRRERAAAAAASLPLSHPRAPRRRRQALRRSTTSSAADPKTRCRPRDGRLEAASGSIRRPERFASLCDICTLPQRETPPGNFCRVIFDKMQGGPAQFIAESHCVVRTWNELLPKAKSREKVAGIAGKSRVAKRPDQGARP